MKLNLPNFISLIRVIIAPFYFMMILSNDYLFEQLACILFLLGAITDYIDGWYARKFNSVTELGKFVDPLADKVLTSTAFLSFVVLKIIPLWMVIIIILRDFWTTFLRIYGEFKELRISTSYSAKVKTSLQMIFITLILILIYLKTVNSSSTGSFNFDVLIYSRWTYYSMLVLTILTIWTMIEYNFQNKTLIKKLFTKKNKNE